MSEPPMIDPRRQLPSVNELVERVTGSAVQSIPVRLAVISARQVLDAARRTLSNGQVEPTTIDEQLLVDHVRLQCMQFGTKRLRPIINATGIILHTGLGRAPLAEAAVRAMQQASGYTPVEINLVSGERGHRSDIVKPMLCDLTGAASATVVNNCTAALVLTLSALAKHHSVIVSRGELVEIGGSFRLPEIMASSGVHLREVGTTNKTIAADYARAVDDDVAMLLKVHRSNYRIEGFTESTTIEQLAQIAHQVGIPLLHDIGSGALDTTSIPCALEGEPTAAQSIRDGADIVLFSGDKLLGGPQAGIIVGRSDLIEQIDNHPLKRALRVDKVILAGLAATLEIHLDPARRACELPMFRMAAMSIDQLQNRAERIAKDLDANSAAVSVHIEPSRAYLGGGSLPGSGMESRALVVRPTAATASDLADRLRHAEQPILTRLERDAVWLDLRTINEADDPMIARSIATCSTL